MTTLTEKLLLLAFDEDTGRNRVSYLDYGLAGAVLLELTVANRIDLSGRYVSVLDATPTGNPFQDAIVQQIQQSPRPRKPKGWIEKLRRGLRDRILQDLVQKSVLHHRKDTVMGMFPMNRYLPVDRTITADVRDRLGQAVDTMTAPDDETASLAALVHALRMERHALPGRKNSHTRKALAAVADQSWVSEATRKAIQGAQAAITAATAAGGAASMGGGG